MIVRSRMTDPAVNDESSAEVKDKESRGLKQRVERSKMNGWQEQDRNEIYTHL